MLDVRGLSVCFTQYQVGLKQRDLQVISNLDLHAAAGEVTAVVGSSGSGKSLLAHAVLGILPSNARVSGHLHLDGEELTPQRQEQWRGTKMALIPQAVTYLDPLMRVGSQVRLSHTATRDSAQAAQRQRKVFARYGLAEHVDTLYPFQLSGGMLRRVLVSTAALSDASLIIADEPTPGLDPVSLAEALRHLRELADEGRAVVLITHDLMAARTIADRVAVFYAGTTLETVGVDAFGGDGEGLAHPYSQALWRSLPENEFDPVPGAQPMPDRMPAGCAFEPRCGRATEECSARMPDMSDRSTGWVRCFHA